MLSCLSDIIKSIWEWRRQVWNLALFELKKQSRGAALGWLWFFIKPFMYIGVFWFALEIGLRAGKSMGGPPYILWLMAGMIPWFYMQSHVGGTGVDVFHKFSYLVNKIKFPLGAIPVIYSVSKLVIQLGMVVVLFAAYFVCGQGLDLYLLQVPIIWVLMIVFFYFFSLLLSCLTAFSKDVKNAMAAFSTPIFWLSGTIFDVSAIDIEWVRNILLFDPVTFLVQGSRACFYDKYWLWEKPDMCLAFACVFIVTVALALFVYKRTQEEISDVL